MENLQTTTVDVNVNDRVVHCTLKERDYGDYIVFDVFEGEPKLDPRFLTLDNVLLQPHHASGTYETRKAMGKLVFDNLAAHFAGRDLPTPVL